MVNLSSPTELQAAIDGNRREGRRTGYDSYPHLFPPMLGSPVSAAAAAAAVAAGVTRPPLPPHTQGLPMPPSSLAFSLPPMSPLPPPPPPTAAAALRPNMFNGSSGGFPGSKSNNVENYANQTPSSSSLRLHILRVPFFCAGRKRLNGAIYSDRVAYGFHELL